MTDKRTDHVVPPQNPLPRLRGVHDHESVVARDNPSGRGLMPDANDEEALEPDAAVSLGMQGHLCIAVITAALAEDAHHLRLGSEQSHGNLLVDLPSRGPRQEVWCQHLVQNTPTAATLVT